MTIDFEYDNILLSALGYIICDFSNSSGFKTVNNGSDIKFTTTSILNGNQWLATGTKYSECLSTTFSICKSPCLSDEYDIGEITVDEITWFSRWLCRKTYKKFKLIKEGYEQIYFEGSFTMDRIMFNERVVGLELKFTTNRPFALYEPCTKTLNFTSSNQTLTFRDISDEIGYIYADTTITCGSSGDFVLYNSVDDRYIVINNCTAGEVITMNYPVIKSSLTTHRIQDDFNFNFFRISNAWNNSLNKITASMPCTIKFTYSPIRKVGV